MTMKLWLLTTLSDNLAGECATAFVVRAKSEAVARALAASGCGNEGANEWLRESESLCIEVLCEGEPEVILAAYRS